MEARMESEARGEAKAIVRLLRKQGANDASILLTLQQEMQITEEKAKEYMTMIDGESAQQK